MDKKKKIKIGTKNRFYLTPYLYMQFIEPLGSADSSIDAAWDYVGDKWRDDVIDAAKELSPPLIRWGGCISSYYRWKEAVGPRTGRKTMMNLCWGGMETNQVGTDEFLDFCKKVGADALINVNFESDGRMNWAYPKCGENRIGTSEEAAQWVDYCNNPGNRLRIKNGIKEPYNVKLWQIGNETSYDKDGFDCEEAVRKTRMFAKKMREVDCGIKLIAWGDSGWARRMLETNSDIIDYIAFHSHFGQGSVLEKHNFLENKEETWNCLMESYKWTEERISEMREEIKGYDVKLAMTESHFWLKARNRGDILSTWAAAVANARILNMYERNGDILGISTLADFFGNRWQVNSLMIPTPRGKTGTYLMPVARVMKMFGRNTGVFEVDVLESPEHLDIAVSRTGNRFYVHVVNTSMEEAVGTSIQCEDGICNGIRLIRAVSDPFAHISEFCVDLFNEKTFEISCREQVLFPPASVSVLVFDTTGECEKVGEYKGETSHAGI